MTLPESVKQIGSLCFSGCVKLKSCNIPSQVTRIEPQTFNRNQSLISITIPDSVNYIGNSAFDGCTKLQTANIPNGITRLEYGIFNNCVSLTNTTIPNTVRFIGQYVFLGCNNITELVIPEGVETLEQGVVHACQKLERIVIPHSVKEFLGQGIFYGHPKLTDVVYNGTKEEWKKIKKTNNWWTQSPLAVIKCTDGEFPLKNYLTAEP